MLLASSLDERPLGRDSVCADWRIAERATFVPPPPLRDLAKVVQVPMKLVLLMRVEGAELLKLELDHDVTSIDSILFVQNELIEHVFGLPGRATED